ncbi:hypothetical protein B0H14DRAFT_1013932 [Mycena olivaceomarginata]|nr:hypothetical protein B0H14DRAFT_1013932 [Mycena olivaceomarginata]
MGWEPGSTTTATVELLQYYCALLLLCRLGVATSYELGWGAATNSHRKVVKRLKIIRHDAPVYLANNPEDEEAEPVSFVRNGYQRG